MVIMTGKDRFSDIDRVWQRRELTNERSDIDDLRVNTGFRRIGRRAAATEKYEFGSIRSFDDAHDRALFTSGTGIQILSGRVERQ